ncbi:MAG: FMN-binding protein [Rhodospirillaceae bacterium]
MRSKFLLFPAAIIATAGAVQPAFAGAQYLTAEQAQGLLFPKGTTFTEDFRLLTDKQMRDIREFSGIELRDRKVRAWRASNGDWFFVDHVLGKDDTVYYGLALSPKGEVKGIEVMECWELYSKVRLPEWRAQFKGKKDGELRIKGDIEYITGVTLSSKHITEGVIRMLSTYTLVFSDQATTAGN